MKKREGGLVTRLLEAYDGNHNGVDDLQKMCREAADLIESLRADLRDICAKQSPDS